MKLTGKTKDNFEKWLKNNYELLIEDVGGFSYFWNAQTKVSEYALIIEFFDSVGYIITIESLAKNMFTFRVDYDKFLDTDQAWKSRKEATEKAITTTNNLYNAN